MKELDNQIGLVVEEMGRTSREHGFVCLKAPVTSSSVCLMIFAWGCTPISEVAAPLFGQATAKTFVEEARSEKRQRVVVPKILHQVLS